MAPVKSGEYVSAFANYVIEHIKDIKKMCREIHRILIPSGTFIASIPNPIAPEFVLARHTPLWFHKKVRQEEAWETHYLYTIEDLINIFENNGMAKQSLKYWSFTEGYLWRYPLLSTFSRLYDRSITRMSIKRMMGDVCIVFKKVWGQLIMLVNSSIFLQVWLIDHPERMRSMESWVDFPEDIKKSYKSLLAPQNKCKIQPNRK